MTIAEEFLVVFHHQYYSDSDNGCRVYNTIADRLYLEEYPSQYRILNRFEFPEDAKRWAAAQPCDGEAERESEAERAFFRSHPELNP